MFNVLTIEEAIKAIKENLNISWEKEEVDLFSALGRVLAEDIYGQEYIPGFTRSTMDGFAVIAADTFGASPSQPAYLRVVGEVKMGEEPAVSLSSEETMKVWTGGALPTGSDAVVMLEQTEWFDDETIAVLKPVAPGENVIFKGEDVKPGLKVGAQNSVIRPQDLGIFAGLGINRIPVWQRKKVGIISTGNEVVEPSVKELLPGKIRDMNSYTLYGLIQQAGGEATVYGIVQDSFPAIRDAVEKALRENQIVVLSGGSSVGAKDLTARVLEDLQGFKFLFHGISIKPGKPTLAAVKDNKLVAGLPGHPVSAMVVFDVIVAPFLLPAVIKRVKHKAVITANVASSPGRQDFIRVKLYEEEGILKAEPILGKSGLISTMVASDGFVTIPLIKEGIAAGETVEVELLGGRY
ncbi:MAG: gephyrin-like molybdotransferase Glp [Bacillota bacterium]